MKTLRWAIAMLVLAVFSSCYLVFNYDPGPTVSLAASSTWIVTGEVSLLTASARDPLREDLTYEWFEDGTLIPGQDGSQLAYRSWADGASAYVEVSVVVRDSRGGSASDSVIMTIAPRPDGAVLVVNNSSTDVWWVSDRPWSSTEWSPDRLGIDTIIPAGTSYVVINGDYLGYTPGWWDVKAENSIRSISWVAEDVRLDAGEVYFFILTDGP